MSRHGGDFRPETNGFLDDGAGGSARQFIQLLAPGWFIVAQQEGVNESAGAEGVASGGLQAIRNSRAQTFSIIEMGGGGETDLMRDRARGNGRRGRNSWRERVSPCLRAFRHVAGPK